jgi:hypothetical protein
MGFERWVKTWIIDYASVSEIYWALDGDEIDLAKAPRRAFDSEQEKQTVQHLFARYNDTRDWTPELDHELDKIAEARMKRHPLRYYLVLPAARIADMWLRPRAEMLGQDDDRWWEVKRHPQASAIAVVLGAVNLFYVSGAAVVAALLLWHKQNPEHRQGVGGQKKITFPWSPPTTSTARYWGLLLGWVLARSLFLGTMGNPEPRYTLECYPVVIVFAAALAAGVSERRLPVAANRSCGTGCGNARTTTRSPDDSRPCRPS